MSVNQARPGSNDGSTSTDRSATEEAALREDFVAAMRLVPGPVAIVAVAHNGKRRGLAATAWSSLSADPPSIIVCVNRQASAHSFFIDGKAFSINLLDHADPDTVAIFSGQRGLEGDDRFVDCDWTRGPAAQPLFTRAVISFECTLVGVSEQDTHSLLIGRVGSVRTRTDGRALLYLDGRFARAVH